MKPILPLVAAFITLALVALSLWAEKAPAPTKPVLDKGMAAADIIKQAGKPLDVVPIESPEGKAEKWLYRRKLKETTSSAAIAPNAPSMMSSQMPNDANSSFQIHVPVAQYRLQRVTIYQVTALLMINDRLEVAKQWTERTETFD